MESFVCRPFGLAREISWLALVVACFVSMVLASSPQEEVGGGEGGNRKRIGPSQVSSLERT